MTDMTTGRPMRVIVSFAIPLTVANLLQQGYLLVDSIVVGRFAGVGAVAALGAVQPHFYLINAMFIGLGTAFAIRLATLRATPGTAGVRPTATALTLFAACWSLVCLLPARLFATPLLELAGIRGALLADSVTFLETLAYGFPGIFGLAALAVFLRGMGDARASMAVTGAGSVLNAALVLWFVGGLGHGVAGAAAATGLAATATLVAGLWHARRRYPPAGDFTWADTGAELRRAVRLGIPIAGQHVVLAIGIMALVAVIDGFGTAGLAAFTVASRLESFTAIVFLDLSAAVTVYMAQNHAAGRTDRVRDALARLAQAAAVLSIAVALIVVSGREPIAAAFTTDPAVRELIARYLLIIFPFFPLYAVMVVAHGYLNGIGRTVVPLVCTLVAFVATQLPAAWLLSGPFGLSGVMWATVAGWLTGLGYTAAVTLRSLRPAVPAR